MPQLVSQEQARAAVERTELNARQRDAAVTMLTAATTATALIAPAGAGKSHTMAEFARLWTSFTGRRVIGLTTFTNAARVLEHEGLAESCNIAEFLGKIEGSDQLAGLHDSGLLSDDEFAAKRAEIIERTDGISATARADANMSPSSPVLSVIAGA